MTLVELFISFMKIGFCSFGGLTMIPIINDEVLSHGWMTMDEVLDIVAVAEMTPGSLGINCATFVGLRVAGAIGAIVASVGVMMPSLTLCMAAAHFVLRLKGNPYLESVLRGVRPVSVGMMLAMAVTLGQTTFLAVTAGSAPDGGAIGVTGLAGISVQWNVVLIAIICGILLFKTKLTIPKTIGVAALLGLFLG